MPIVNLTEAAAWVEDGVLTLRLGPADRPLIELRAPVTPSSTVDTSAGEGHHGGHG
jgi:hypothetical protein